MWHDGSLLEKTRATLTKGYSSLGRCFTAEAEVVLDNEQKQMQSGFQFWMAQRKNRL